MQGEFGLGVMSITRSHARDADARPMSLTKILLDRSSRAAVDTVPVHPSQEPAFGKAEYERELAQVRARAEARAAARRDSRPAPAPAAQSSRVAVRGTLVGVS